MQLWANCRLKQNWTDIPEVSLSTVFRKSYYYGKFRLYYTWVQNLFSHLGKNSGLGSMFALNFWSQVSRKSVELRSWVYLCKEGIQFPKTVSAANCKRHCSSQSSRGKKQQQEDTWGDSWTNRELSQQGNYSLKNRDPWMVRNSKRQSFNGSAGYLSRTNSPAQESATGIHLHFAVGGAQQWKVAVSSIVTTQKKAVSSDFPELLACSRNNAATQTELLLEHVTTQASDCGM